MLEIDKMLKKQLKKVDIHVSVALGLVNENPEKK